MHVGTGAGFEIFAFLLYLAALAVTYLQARRRERKPKEETRSLVAESVARPMSVTTTTLMPDGGQRTERKYIDETGQVIHEVTVLRSDSHH
jgi:hypothetical protein